MECNLLDFLSPQQKQIYILLSAGHTRDEVARRLGIKKNTVKTQSLRIQKKIRGLEDNYFKVNYNIIDYDKSDEIAELFEQETDRSLPKSHTVKQMQFLSETKQMHTTSRTRQSNYYYRQKLGLNNEITTRKLTSEEIEIVRKRVPNPHHIPADVKRLEMFYQNLLKDPNASTEVLARMELILRSYGCLYFTPGINKLNAKTTKALRAKEEGYTATIVYPGEGVLLPQGSKFLESVKDGTGNTEYSVWLVPRR